MRCLAWNCRGLHRTSAERTLRGIILDCDADLIFLSETKVGSELMINITRRLGFANVVCILADGIAGGFCVAWRNGVECNVSQVFESGFHLVLKEGLGNGNWSLFCIYGTPYHSKKRDIWQGLTEKVEDCNQPWALLGDLNVILDPSEKIGGRPFDAREGRFLASFLFNTGGIDLGCGGDVCTWQNSRRAENRVRKRLDRVIANAIWCTLYPRAFVQSYPILGSDHAPLFLNSWGAPPKLKFPFRFLEVWTSNSDCEKVITKAWRSSVSDQSEGNLQRKFTVTKNDLKRWNAEVFGFCDKKLRILRTQLSHIQKETILKESVEREAEVQLEILDLEEKMGRIWRQKSHENWLRFGDSNSKFFHASTIIRSRRNHIGGVLDDSGEWLKQRKEIRDYFLEHFRDLYGSENPEIDPELDSLFVDKVTVEENDSITRIPEESEIKEVVFKLHPLKSPGPDGYSGIFF
ncbi:uncharacterized protein LOC115695005 [Cannabis sativa]|uniref:uncharacterized protein LOC115695005 n=1 Tax=Cannabis sativa TaxID=3483 RepID=UPI0011DFB6B7|nr:uncharacterized protein LOC115695005 [Cannabis sativa]